MYLEHASYSYPTHLVPLVDLALTLLLLALLAWICHRDAVEPRTANPAWLDKLWSTARSASRAGARTLVGLFVLGLLASAASHLMLGPPVPRVVDEFSYLYGAETFARGDLTNPPNPHHDHFEMVHVLPEPTVQSKYPPAQALVLALGVALGEPAAALWLMTGLLTAAVAWLLSLRLPPPWPLLGAFLALFRVGLGSYWNQSFWGGSVAAFGGILALGAAWTCARRFRPGPAAVLGFGLIVLATSRPFEGLLFALPLAWFLASRLLRASNRRRAMVVPPLLAVLASGALALGAYHHAVTGDPLLFPHSAYSESVGIGDPHFLWQVDSNPWWWKAATLGLERTTFVLFFFLGLGGSVLAFLAWPDVRRSSFLRLATAAAAATLFGAFLTRPFFVHYSAPLAGVVVLLSVVGLRRLTLRLTREGRDGRLLAPAFVAAQLVLCLVQLPAHRPDADSTARHRQAVEAWLGEEPGLDLVFLCSDWLRDDWMFNPPDLETAEVLWVRELSDDENEALVADFPARQVWHLVLDQDGVELRQGRHDGEVTFTRSDGDLRP